MSLPLGVSVVVAGNWLMLVPARPLHAEERVDVKGQTPNTG